jgi:chromate transporter
VLIGGRYFLRLKNNDRLQAFLTGASAASIGAITGSAIPLGLSLTHLWQIGVLALAGLWLLAFKRNLVVSLILAGALGALASVAGWPVH